MQKITKVVGEWSEARFGDEELEIAEDGSRATCRFSCHGKGDFEYPGFVEVYEKRALAMVFLYVAIKVPPRHRDAVAKLLALVNFNLINGWIGMDMKDGELRYKSSISVADGALTPAMLNEMVDSGISILDRNIPAITDMIFAGASADSAFNKIASSKSRSAPVLEPVSPTTVRPWESFSGVESIRGWVSDICRAMSDGTNVELWKFAGRGVVLVNEDRHYSREVLMRVAADCKMAFVNIQAEDVISMFPFDSLKRSPTLVYLESGAWMLERPDEDSGKSVEEVRAFQSGLCSWMESIDAEHPVIFTLSVGRLRDVAVSLRKVGAFDRFIGLPAESAESIGNSFLDKVGRECCGQDLLNTPAKIGNLLKTEMSEMEQRDLAALCLQRMFWHEKRGLKFVDLVHVVTRTLHEEMSPGTDAKERRKQTAVHEAGHAIAALLDSGGKNVPEYVSILPSALFNGIVVESMAFHQARDEFNSYQDFRHNIRICLAGRAAEEVVYGPSGITTGSSADLEQATRHAHRAFASWGFAPQMDSTGKTGSNLAVVFGKPTPSEWEHVEGLVRTFLGTEYEKIKTVLSEHRDMLDVTVARLLEEPIMSQQELSGIYTEFQPTLNQPA